MTGKAVLRASLLAARGCLRESERVSAATAIAARLQMLLEPYGAVAAYHAVRGEVDLSAVLALLAMRKPVALPVIEGDTLRFRTWRPGQPLRTDRLGLMEPLPDAALLVPEAILLPLVGFDARGHRLGYGGGYYDRLLADPVYAGAYRIGIAYDIQQVARLPDEPHDAMLDAVVTETMILTFERAR